MYPLNAFSGLQGARLLKEIMWFLYYIVSVSSLGLFYPVTGHPLALCFDVVE